MNRVFFKSTALALALGAGLALNVQAEPIGNGNGVASTSQAVHNGVGKHAYSWDEDQYGRSGSSAPAATPQPTDPAIAPAHNGDGKNPYPWNESQYGR